MKSHVTSAEILTIFGNIAVIFSGLAVTSTGAASLNIRSTFESSTAASSRGGHC